ncbi:MAG: hypothetical protein MK132_25810 [Lentisphaerales bacterium]|nr:hypothetical protein [Lentisphaerales bacterium]
MAIDYTYDDENNTVNCAVSGIFTSEQLVDYFIRVSNDEKIAHGFLEIVDLEPDDIIVKHSDIAKIAEKASY